MVFFRRRKADQVARSQRRQLEIETGQRISHAWPELLDVDELSFWGVSMAPEGSENQPGVHLFGAHLFADDRLVLSTFLVAGARVSAPVARVHGPGFGDLPPLDGVTCVAHDGWVYAFRHHSRHGSTGALGYPIDELNSEISRLGVQVVR